MKKNNYTNLIYLYFLHRNGGNQNMFFDELFHFYRYVSLNKLFIWKRWFSFNRYDIMDEEAEKTFSLLHFHDWTDELNRLTETGLKELVTSLAEDSFIQSIIDKFFAQYESESATKKSCFTYDPQQFPVSCHTCTTQECIFKKGFDLKGLLKIKNPYKEIQI
jgi:hypothetical protein